MPWLVVALVLTVATVLITVAIHLPLNAAIQDAASVFLEIADLRFGFEDRWVRWYVVRTLTSTGGSSPFPGLCCRRPFGRLTPPRTTRGGDIMTITIVGAAGTIGRLVVG